MNCQRHPIAMVAALLLLAVPAAFGVNRTWNGGGNNNNWTTSANWGGTAPSANDSLFFGGTTRRTPNNDFAAGTQFNGITFNSGAGLFTLAGAAINLAGDVVNNDNSLQTVNLALALTGSFQVNAGTGELSFGGGITSATAGTKTLTVTGANNTTIGGVVGNGSGVLALTKSGNGVLALNNANTYSGGTIISAGQITVGVDNALGTGALTMNGGVLELNEFNVSIAGLSGSSGTIQLTAGNTARTLTVGDASDWSFGGVITDATHPNTHLTLTKVGTGKLTLSGNNSHSGAVNVNAGIVNVQHNAALGTTAGGVTVASGAALELDGSLGALTIGAEALTLNGAGVTASPGGALRNISGNNTYSGLITLAGSSRINSDLDTLTLNVSSGNALTTANSLGSITLTLGGAGNVTVADPIAQGSGTTLAVAKEGAGVLTLSGAAANTYSGLTTVSASELDLGKTANVNAIGAGGLTINTGGTVKYTGSSTDMIGNSSAVTINGSGVLNLNGINDTVGNLVIAGTGAAAGTYDNVTTGNGNLTVGTLGFTALAGVINRINVGSGALTLGGDVTFTAATTGQAQITGTSVTSTLALGGNRQFTVGLGSGTGYDLDISGIISGSGNTLTKLGTGRLQFSGTAHNTYSGLTTVSAGELDLGKTANVNAIANGGLTVGTGATVKYTGTSTDAIGNSSAVTINGTGVLNLNGNSDTVGNLAIAGTGAAAGTYNNVTTGNGNLTIGTLGFTALAGVINTVSMGTGALTLGGDVTFTAATTGQAQITGSSSTSTLALGGNRQFTVGLGSGTGYDLDINGVISGSGNTLTKLGTGRLQFSGTTANTYSGLTTVSAGELDLNKTANVNAIANGGLTIGAGATVKYTGTSTDAIGNSSAVTINGSGVLNLNGINDTVGNLVIGGTGAAAGTYDNVTTGNGNLTVGTLGFTALAGVINRINVGSGALTLGGDVTFTAATTGQAQITGTSVTSTLALGGNRQFTVGLGSGTGYDLDINGVISGSGNTLTKLGTGRLQFSGTTANTYGGLTTVSGGELDLSKTAGLDAVAGNLSIGAGTVKLLANHQIANTATVMLNHAAAVLNLNGFSETVDALYLGDGTIQGGNLTGSSYSVTNGTISANLGGASSVLTKGGSGTVVLSGNNTFAGGVTVDAGVLQLGHAGALNSATPNTVTLGSGTLRLNSYSVTVADLSGNGVVENASASGATLTVNKTSGSSTVTAILQDGTGAGALALTKTGSGTVTLSGANTYSGLTTISAGTLELGDRLAAQNSTVSNLVDGGLVFSAVTNRYVLGGLAGTGNIGLTNTAGSLLGLSVGSNGSNTTYSGQLSGDGSLTKAGSGTLILSGVNNHTGGTVINGGTLSVGADSNLGNASGLLTFDGGTLLSTASFNTSRTISNLTAGGTFAVASGTLRVDGVIAGPGSLTKVGSGALSLTASNTFTGNLLMQAGTLVVSNQYALQNNTLNFTGGAVTFGANISTFSAGGLEGNQNLALTDGGGAGIALAVGGNGDSTTYSGQLSGAGSLTKVGGGTLTLTGNNNYSGATVVSSGKLVVNGSLLTSTVTVNGGTLGGTGTVAGTMVVASGGHLAPGNSVGVQEYGTLTLESGGFLDIEFNTALSQTNDHFIVNNSGGLAINSGAKVNLYLEGGTSPFTDLGLYYLINYTGSPVDPSGLSVANNAFNRSYSFGTSAGASNWVVLTVGGAGRGWTGDSEVDAYWQTGANWVGGVAPVAFDQLLFDGNTRVNNTNNFAANTKFNGIAFTNSNGIGNFTLNGNTVNLVGNVVNLSGLSQTINLNLALDGATRTFSANGTLTVNGDISDDGGGRGLTKTGAGTLILNGVNSYRGETAVLGGALRIAGAALPDDSLLTLGGGVVELSAANFVRNLGTDPGEVRWTDDGGFSAYGGDRTVTINSGAALTWGQVNFVPSGKTLKLGSDGANSKVVFSNPINLGSGDRQISVAGGWAEMSGGLSGSGGGLIKTGSGGLIVSGVNNYSGATAVSNGTLVVNGAITGGSSLTVASGALLMGTGVVAGVIQGTGAISPGDGPGILTVGQVDPNDGLSFNFEFTNIGSPDYTQPGASSNDVLRITNASTPFIAALALTNTVNLTISTALVIGETNIFRGGFYTDAGDFTAAITNANYLVNLGTLLFVRMTNDNSFAGTGYVMEFGVLGQDPIIVVPEPNVLALWLTGLGTITFVWRRHDRLKKRLDLA